MKMKHLVSTGDRFGRLRVVELKTIRKAGQPLRRAAVCRCDCGETAMVLVQNLFRKDTPVRSCGCMKRKGTMSSRFAETRSTQEKRDALRRANLRHGLSKHPSYFRWYNMIDRCTNPDHRAYANYGGRGISVAPEWRDVATFLNYIDQNLGPCPEGHSLDRIDNDGDYEPGNVRWATRSQQARNRRP